MPAGGRARGVEERGLHQENEGTVGDLAVGRGVFRPGNLVQGAAEVNGDGAAALACGPGYGVGEGVVDLKSARPIAKLLQGFAIGLLEPVGGKAQKLPRSDIAEDQAWIGAGLAVEFRQGRDALLRS